MLITCGAGAAPPAVAVNEAVEVCRPMVGSVGGVTPPPSPPPHCSVSVASAAVRRRERAFAGAGLVLMTVVRRFGVDPEECSWSAIDFLGTEREGTGRFASRQEGIEAMY